MYLLFATMLLLFTTFPQPIHTHNVANHANNPIDHSAQIPPICQSVRHSNQEGTTHQGERENNYDPLSDRLYRRYLCATIVGVMGGFIGIVILIWQAILTRSSANAARDAAVAAKNSSEAIINSERPWLFINIITDDNRSNDAHGIPEDLTFYVSFQNYGKTPAEIVGFDQHPDCRQDPDDLPWPAKYPLEGRVLAHTRLVPPGGKWRDTAESSFHPREFLLDDEWKDIRGSRRRLVYWGRLQYRDLIVESKTIHELEKVGLIHETCFCYFWSPPLNDFLICGPVGYNKHT